MKGLKVGKRYPTWRLANEGYTWKYQTKGLLDVYESRRYRIVYDQTSGRIVYKEVRMKQSKMRRLIKLNLRGWKEEFNFGKGLAVMAKRKWRILYDIKNNKILKVYKDEPVPACN